MEDQYYDIERRTAIKEEARMFRRKFITYEQAEVIYSISHRKIRDLAEAAGAVSYCCDLHENYLKAFFICSRNFSAIGVKV